MTIKRKLQAGFGIMIGLSVVLAVVDLIGLARERAGKRNTARSFQVMRQTSILQDQLSQNQIHLNNYLLSGDSSEADKVISGVTQLNEAIQRTEAEATELERTPLERLNEAEHDWNDHFARPLIDKRKQVDSGNGTVAELQIFYLQLNPTDWLKKLKDPVDQIMAATQSGL
jgi:CHASE3 domain sensor protein